MATEKSERVWFIIGSSSGFGRLLTKRFLDADIPDEELSRVAR